jgi:chromosome segregation ATPase
LKAQLGATTQALQTASEERTQAQDRHQQEEEEMRLRLDALRDQAKKLEEENQRLIAAGHDAGTFLQKQHAALAVADGALSQRRSELENLRAQLSRLTRSLEQAQSHMDATNAVHAEDETAARLRLSGILENVQQAEDEFTARQRDIAAQEARARDELLQVQTSIAEAQRMNKEALASHQQEVNGALEDLARARDDLARLNSEFDNKRDAAARMAGHIQADITRDERRLASIRDAIKAAKAREREATADCGELEQNATALAMMLKQAQQELNNVRRAEADAAGSLATIQREITAKADELAAMRDIPRFEASVQTDVVEEKEVFFSPQDLASEYSSQLFDVLYDINTLFRYGLYDLVEPQATIWRSDDADHFSIPALPLTTSYAPQRFSFATDEQSLLKTTH